MLIKLDLRSLVLHLLFLMNLMNASNAEKIQTLSSSSSIFEDTTQVFFNYKDLKIGTQMTIYFGGAFSSRIPHFLPKDKANLIPFSSKNLPFILEYFNFDPKSPQAKAIAYTLDLCEIKGPHKEHARCVTSLESMLEFVRKTFNNSNSNSVNQVLRLLSTSPLPKTSKLLQNYTIMKQPKPIASTKMVVCHMLTYPYAVFMCHYQKTKDQLFAISLLGEDGAYVDAIANCHINTSSWDPNYVAFRILGFKPGTAPICHYVPSNDLVWVLADRMVNSYSKQ